MLNDLGAMACRNAVFIHEMAGSIIADNDVSTLYTGFDRRHAGQHSRHLSGISGKHAAYPGPAPCFTAAYSRQESTCSGGKPATTAPFG